VILADTSIWIDHLRVGDPTLVGLMEAVQLVMHPLVIGELAMGNFRFRSARLREWGELPLAEISSHSDVLLLVEREKLYGRGIGYVDAALLASVLAMEGKLWTRDRRLVAAARELKVEARLDN